MNNTIWTYKYYAGIGHFFGRGRRFKARPEEQSSLATALDTLPLSRLKLRCQIQFPHGFSAFDFEELSLVVQITSTMQHNVENVWRNGMSKYASMVEIAIVKTISPVKSS